MPLVTTDGFLRGLGLALPGRAADTARVFRSTSLTNGTSLSGGALVNALASRRIPSNESSGETYDEFCISLNDGPQARRRHPAAWSGNGVAGRRGDRTRSRQRHGGGYRLIDTAENYANEVGVGRGLKASGIAREDVFVTTKFNKRWHGVELVQQAFEASAARLGVDYVDLLLIHWPNPGQNRYVDAWRGLLTLFEQGRVRAIGTSNFKPAHLDRLLAETGELPDVNQIQCRSGSRPSRSRAYHDAKASLPWPGAR